MYDPHCEIAKIDFGRDWNELEGSRMFDIVLKSTKSSYPNFEEEELFQEIRQKSFSPKQMPWEPSKIKEFNEVLERNEYH
jgi:hypothetical protein